MEFGKVSSGSLSRIDLNLPSQDPRTWLRLRLNGEERKDLRVGVGCPVWNVKDWLGKIYPRGTQAQDFLHFYSRQFNSIELNQTHYRIPDLDTIRRWRNTVPEDFRFNPKFPQDISHRRPLSGEIPEVKEFVKNVMELGDRLGITFLQLPPQFTPDHLPELRKLLAALPFDFPFAVEVRHPAFFREHMMIDPLYDLLTKMGAHTVITDVAGRRDVLHSSLTSTKVLVRFIGNDLHPTDHFRIQDWVSRLHDWISLGLEQVEFFVHEPHDVNAPDLIRDFTESLNQECDLNIRIWKPENQGEQLGLF